LNMDLQTLLMFCGTNDRIHTICNQNAFWYLKLKHDYPGYVLFYQKSKTQLGKLVYQDLLKDAKGYYVFYHQFRTCFDTFKINAHFKGAKLDTMSVLAGLRNNLSLTNDLLKKLFSLTLMYVKPSFEQHITRMESTLFLKRYKLFSTEVLVNSMLPEQYYDQFGVFMRDYPTWKEAEPLKAKIMHCVLQVYINANLNYYKRDYLSYFTLTNATLPTQCQPFRY